jgi:hypothetical protein
MECSDRVVRFLVRSSRPTWTWERLVVVAIEALLWGVTVVVTPPLLAAVTGLFGGYLAVRAQAARSVAARRRERGEALGLPAIELHCDAEDERRARGDQLLGGLSPVVAIVLAAAGSGVTAAVLAGAACTGARWAYGFGYGRWRRWYAPAVAAARATENDVAPTSTVNARPPMWRSS